MHTAIKIWLLAAAAVWSAGSLCRAQVPVHLFRHLSIENGLSQNTVNAILQDYQGYMWFGTKDGLNRFDGYTSRIYKSDPFDSTSVSDNHITSILEDDKQRLWIGTRLGGLNLYDRERDAFVRVTDRVIEGKPLIINSITGNSKVGIWVSSFNGHVVGLDIPEADRGGRIQPRVKAVLDQEDLGGALPANLLLDDQGILWILTGQGLHLYDTVGKKMLSAEEEMPTYEALPEADLRKSRREEYSPFNVPLFDIVKDERGHIWITGYYGVYQFDPARQEFRFYNLGGFIRTAAVTTNRDGDLEIWAGFYVRGLAVLNTATLRTEMVEYTALSHNSTRDGVLSKIFKSRDGTIWMGTNGRGVIYYSPGSVLFENNMPMRVGNALRSSVSVYSVCPLKKTGEGSILVNTLLYFLHLDQQNRVMRYDTTVYARVMREGHDGRAWLGSTSGLIVYDPATRRYTILDKSDRVILGLYLDEPNKRVWYTTPNTLKLYNIRDSTLRVFALDGGRADSNELEEHESLYSTIEPDPDGSLWIGTINGLYRFDPQREKIIAHYRNDPADRSSISSNEIKSILPDPAEPGRVIWVGTPVGLNRLDKQSGEFTHFNTRDGLPNNTVYGILSDDEGNLWLSTNQGLSVFNTATHSFTNFDVSNGLQSNEFNTGAYHKSDDGELFFGGINGYNRFYPGKIRIPGNDILIVISDIKTPGSNIYSGFSLTQVNRLDHDNNNISITLSSLDYASPEKTRYAYRIYNRDTTWIDLGNNRNVTLTNLSPGRYVFQARATDSYGRWGSKTVEMVFVISPPWWASVWAYGAYLALALAVLYYMWLRYKRHIIQQHEIENERRQAAAILEMDEVKSRFLANITHEFRTPLTVILGATETVPAGSGEIAGRKFELVRRNGRQLLQLVDQILDLSRLESGRYTLTPETGDIRAFLVHIVSSFESLAAGRQINLSYEMDFREVSYRFDHQKLQQVLSNLVSNAIKYSPDRGEISVRAWIQGTDEAPGLTVEVEDNGPGIPEADLDKIFDRFHRTSLGLAQQLPGTGIGLALARELVQAMGGEIQVGSELGKGSVFSFHIPLEKAGHETGADIQPVYEPVEAPDIYTAAPAHTVIPAVQVPEDAVSILIVEDNPDVLEYIVSCLQERFRLVTAVNGSEGLEKALEYIPDIVISDVMMPEKDGFTLCDDLKNNPVTSHIPVVLLTAKVDAGSVIEGLKKGADSYLAKPFDREELLLRLENMSQLISRMRERYRTVMHGPAEALEEVAGPEDIFLLQVMAILEDRYAAEEYSIEDMAQQLFMSRSQLFRKVKALTGDSPSVFLRSFRLKKARELFDSNKGLTVSEVAYAVGFSSPRYFSNVFLEEFGYRPGQS